MGRVTSRALYAAGAAKETFLSQDQTLRPLPYSGMAIRDPQKPNQLAADKSGFGSGPEPNDFDSDDTLGAGGFGDDNDNDDAAPQMMGGPDHMDHNSGFLKNKGIPVD